MERCINMRSNMNIHINYCHIRLTSIADRIPLDLGESMTPRPDRNVSREGDAYINYFHILLDDHFHLQKSLLFFWKTHGESKNGFSILEKYYWSGDILYKFPRTDWIGKEELKKLHKIIFHQKCYGNNQKLYWKETSRQS